MNFHGATSDIPSLFTPADGPWRHGRLLCLIPGLSVTHAEEEQAIYLNPQVGGQQRKRFISQIRLHLNRTSLFAINSTVKYLNGNRRNSNVL